jgi:hypothetical protein
VNKKSIKRKRVQGHIYDQMVDLFAEIQKRFPTLTVTQILRIALVALYNTQLSSDKIMETFNTKKIRPTHKHDKSKEYETRFK